jgi:hypothetical protein
MVLVSNSWKLWLVGLASSLVIFAVVFFTVIQPAQNTANQALKTGLQQSQQVINQAQKQFKASNAAAGAANGQAQKVLNQAQKQIKTSGAAVGAANTQAQQTLNKAAKLTACVQAAGADPSSLAACQTKFGH